MQQLADLEAELLEEIAECTCPAYLAMNLDINREDRLDWLKVKNRAYSQAEGRHALLSRTRKL